MLKVIRNDKSTGFNNFSLELQQIYDYFLFLRWIQFISNHSQQINEFTRIEKKKNAWIFILFGIHHKSLKLILFLKLSRHSLNLRSQFLAVWIAYRCVVASKACVTKTIIYYVRQMPGCLCTYAYRHRILRLFSMFSGINILFFFSL